jgi:murein DD-endopeptidase MepM/ murein hydrolase activator NlpD
MGRAGDDRVADPRTRRKPVPPQRFGGGDGDVVPFRPRVSIAQRLERERAERERVEREKRERIERERAERDRALEARLEERRRVRLERLRREREQRDRKERYVWSRRKASAPPERGRRVRPEPAKVTSRSEAEPARAEKEPQPKRAEPARARIDPAVEGPVRRRTRAAENRRRASTRRRGLFWPTAKAGLAVTVVLGLSAGLGSVLGLPVPGPDSGAGSQSLASSASIFGIDAGTPPGLAPGYVFPLIGPHDFGEAQARFGASRYGHVHEGQDIFGKTGTPEVAVHDGIVIDRGKATDPDSGGRGNFLTIYSPQDNHSFVYMHMLKPSPALVGKQVHAGQLIGRLGCTGSCDGPHLHFEVRVGKATPGAETKPIDPLSYLRRWPQPTPG